MNTGDVAELVTQARARRPELPARRELATAAATGSAFLACATAFAVAAGWHRAFDAPLAVVLVVAFALCTHIELEIASGSAVPTQLVFVPMLFTLPLPLVPLAVCGGYLLGGLGDAVRGHAHVFRIGSLIGCSWFALPPSLVLFAAGAWNPGWSHWPIYLAAFGSQCAADALHSLLHERLAHGVAPEHLLYGLGSIYALDALLAPVGFLAAVEARWAFLALLPLVFILSVHARERRQRFDARLDAVDLADLAIRDPLTGLLNRRGFERQQAVLWQTEPGDMMVLCLLDLDHLKEYNDRHGHTAGDELIRAVAASWTSELRYGDVLGRIGGDEFALLLPRCTRSQADVIANRLIAAMPLGATCSVGLARRTGSESPEALRQRADDALYAAKHGGRSRRASGDL